MSSLLERCRLCMKRYSSPAALKNIFFDGAFTVETIRVVTRIEVVEGDGLPPYACQLCIYQLKNAKNFIQSCIDCNEKLKLLCVVQATISTAHEESSLSTGPPHPIESESFSTTKPLLPVTTPDSCFPGQLKTEPSSPRETDSGFQMIEQETYVLIAHDNTEDCLEPKEENNIVDETDAADISFSRVKLVRENNLQVKAEQIVEDEYFEGEPLLLAANDNPGMPGLKPTNSGIFSTCLETNGMDQGNKDPILTELTPLNEVSSASCQQLLHTTTKLSLVGEDSCAGNLAAENNTKSTELNRMECSTHSLQHELGNVTEDVEQDEKTASMAETPATDSGHLVGSKPLPLRCQSGPRRLLRSLSKKRKRGLQCRKCLRVFQRLSLLRQHACDSMESCNPFDCSRMFECSDCSAGFSSHASLEIHHKQHTRNYNSYCKVGLDSQASDFDINSSDSENSIFKCPDSEDSNRDFKSSDSETSNLKASSDSEDHDLQSVSDSDSCEIDTISLESDSSVLRSNSDSDEPEIDTSLESEGSGLRPNSDSERSCRDSSTDSVDSAAKSEDLDSNLDLLKAGSPLNTVNFGHGSVTSLPNAEHKKNAVDESLQVCTRPTTTLQSTTRLRNKSERSLGLTANSDCLAENLDTGDQHFLRSGRVNSLEKRKRCIEDKDAGNKQQRKRRHCISSELGSQEKSNKGMGDCMQFVKSGRVIHSEEKGKLPCVRPGESHGVLASVGPVCARTRSKVLSEDVSDVDHLVGFQPSLGLLSVQAKKCVIRKELEYVKQCEEVKQKNTTNCKVNGEEIGNHKDRDLLNVDVGKTQKCNNVSQTKSSVVAKAMKEKCAKARERDGLKRNMEKISKGLQQEKGNSKEKVQEDEVLKNKVQCITATKHVEHIMSKRSIEKKAELKTCRELSTDLFNSKENSTANIREDNAEPNTNIPNKKITGMVKVGNVKRNNSMAGRRSMIENGSGSTTARDPLNPAVSVLEKASLRRKSLGSAAPDMSFRCWKCSREFTCSSKLIKHFRRHLQAIL